MYTWGIIGIFLFAYEGLGQEFVHALANHWVP